MLHKHLSDKDTVVAEGRWEHVEIKNGRAVLWQLILNINTNRLCDCSCGKAICKFLDVFDLLHYLGKSITKWKQRKY